MEDDEEVEQEEVGQRHAIPVDLLCGAMEESVVKKLIETAGPPSLQPSSPDRPPPPTMTDGG